MEAKAKLFGHPIHQMLVPIPFGLFVTAAVLDVIAALTGSEGLTVVSYWNIVIGIGAGLVAAVFGLTDWTSIPRGTRAKTVGLLHAGANVLMLAAFAGAIAIRWDEPYYRVPGGALALEILALLLGSLSGWLGGELVDRYGIGVQAGAHPDNDRSRRAAPSTALSHRGPLGEGGAHARG